MTVWRETNHLRKWANAAGKLMRGPRHRKAEVDIQPDPICATCECLKSSHERDEPWKRGIGCCNQFTPTLKDLVKQRPFTPYTVG